MRHGYRVIPVNPREPEILGEHSYASLRDIPEPVDVVNVFRAADALPDIARDELPDSEHHEISCDMRDETGRVVYRGELTYRGTVL